MSKIDSAGQLLCDKLRLHGMSQSELARRIGVGRGVICRLCYNQRAFDAEIAIKLEYVFHNISARTWMETDAEYMLKVVREEMK